MAETLNATAIRRHAEQSSERCIKEAVEDLATVRTSIEEFRELNQLLGTWDNAGIEDIRQRIDNLLHKLDVYDKGAVEEAG
jgi:hypothetical protein